MEWSKVLTMSDVTDRFQITQEMREEFFNPFLTREHLKKSNEGGNFGIIAVDLDSPTQEEYNFTFLSRIRPFGDYTLRGDWMRYSRAARLEVGRTLVFGWRLVRLMGDELTRKLTCRKLVGPSAAPPKAVRVRGAGGPSSEKEPGVEAKGNVPGKVVVEPGSIIHLSQATHGGTKKDNETVLVHVTVGVEAKGNVPGKVVVEPGSIIHLSQATHGGTKKDNETVLVHVTVGVEAKGNVPGKVVVEPGSIIHLSQVSPRDIPAPKDSGLPLNAYLLHNLAHVELNAIDLAWDTVVRFSPYLEILGEGFFADFAHVADDESRHFIWCSQRLSELGFSYGDMPAHNLLWRECEKSSDNVAARLATIPLVQEARGLDAGPRLVKKMLGFGDKRTSSIVSKIAEEEVAHVAVGVYWFVSVCQKMGRVPCSTFKDLLKEYELVLKGPFNHSARTEAGLPRHWYDPEPVDHECKEQLSEVYSRLTHVIAMETEAAGSSTSSV